MMEKQGDNMLVHPLAVDIAALLSTFLPMAFPPKSSSAVLTAILHCAVIVVTKLAHLDRALWDTVDQGTTIRMAEFLHEDWTALDTVLKLAALRVALGPQPDRALDAAVVLGARAGVALLRQSHLAVDGAGSLRAVVVVPRPDHLYLAVRRAIFFCAVRVVSHLLERHPAVLGAHLLGAGPVVAE